MSQADTRTTVRQGKPRPNVYTVLAIIATLVLAAGVGFLWNANTQMTQDIPDAQDNPFYMIESDATGR